MNANVECWIQMSFKSEDMVSKFSPQNDQICALGIVFFSDKSDKNTREWRNLFLKNINSTISV